MIIYSWQLTLVTVAVIPALIGVTYYFSQKYENKFKQSQLQRQKLNHIWLKCYLGFRQ